MSISSLLKHYSRGIYFSIASNGLFATGIDITFSNNKEDKSSKKRIIKKHWHTSYPLNKIVKPHWYTKKYSKFMDAVLHQINKEFVHEYFPNGIPVITDDSKNVGADEFIVYSVQNNSYTKELKSMFPSLEKQINMFSGADINMPETLHNYLELFTEKVVVLDINFMNITLTELIPKTFAGQTKWAFKKTTLKYNTIDSYIKRVLNKGYLDFFTNITSEPRLHNLLLNHSFYKPATTSSFEVIDFYRAVYFDLISDMVSNSKIAETNGGILIITGELPAFLRSNVSFFLLTLDILAIKGLWAVYIDTYMSFLPLVLHNPKQMSFGLSTIADKWHIVYSAVGKKIPDALPITINNNKYLGIKGQILRYQVNTVADIVESGDKNSLYLHPNSYIETLIIDLRKRPIKYGRKLAGNVVNIKEWLTSLSNVNKSRNA